MPMKMPSDTGMFEDARGHVHGHLQKNPLYIYT
jgi:hypothetical protein